MIETQYGSFIIGADVSHYLTYDEELSYGTGELYQRCRHPWFHQVDGKRFSGWSMNDYFAGLSWNYIGASESNSSDEDYPQWDVFNGSVGYDFGERGVVTSASP